MSAAAPLADVMITLGARDFPSLRGFYRDLGWPQIVDDGQCAAFALRASSSRCFPSLSSPATGTPNQTWCSGGIRCTIGIMVDAAGEVDQLAGHMRDADARVTKEPIDAEFFTGRSAYLCDPEGNYYEITWAEPDNPITSRRTARA